MAGPDIRPPPVRLVHVAAVAAGNALEFYDFVAYAFFAGQIGRSFFPSADAGSSLLASLATFGAGFLMRPVGALALGALGDRLGRKPAMILSLALMGVAMAGLSLTPPRTMIGLAAPALAIVWRLMQGFALGGDVGPSTAFLAESAPDRRRGLYVSLQFAGQYASTFAAGAAGFILSQLMTPAALDAWGWRIAFLLGAAAVPLAGALRARLAETHHPAVRTAKAPFKPSWAFAGPALLGFMMLAGGTTATYVLNYMTTFASTVLRLPNTVAFAATAVIGLCGTGGAVLSGAASDRFGRKRIILPAATALLLVALPAFELMLRERSAAALLAAVALLSACVSSAFSVVMCALTEWLPQGVRSGALGMIYALAISVFGGSTQFIVTWLSRITGSPLVPGWYMTAGVAVCLAASILFPETKPTRPQALQGAAKPRTP